MFILLLKYTGCLKKKKYYLVNPSKNSNKLANCNLKISQYKLVVIIHSDYNKSCIKQISSNGSVKSWVFKHLITTSF